MTKGHFLFLGTGASMGIPVIGCHCAVCQSESPLNKRMRPSALVTTHNKKILIDCGPDYRWQALRLHIDSLDGMLLTHAHHDHIAGLDELRVYFMRKRNPLPCLLSKETANEVRHRYAYLFDNTSKYTLLPKVTLQELPGSFGITSFEGIPINYLTYAQGGMKVTGFRFGNLAYLSDLKDYPEDIFDHLQGLETLIISALRMESSPMHLTVDEAVAFAQRVGATHTWLTHIAHELEHEKTNDYLPPNVRMAYDGLELTF